MTNESSLPIEMLTATLPLNLSRKKTVSDSSGNTVTYPSFSDKITLFSGPDLAKVYNANGVLMCAISQEKAYAIENVSGMSLLAAIATRTYSFEASVGSIPNLCKKKESPSK